MGKRKMIMVDKYMGKERNMVGWREGDASKKGVEDC
jgi:hypothetical protein